MKQIFLTILNMSAAAGVVIAVVLLARLLLRRAPKKWSYLLWSVAALRLCCPVSLKSAFSVFRLKPLQGAATAATDAVARQTSTITYIPQITAPVVTPVMPVSPVTPAAPVTPVTPMTPAAEIAQSTPSVASVLMWVAVWLWVAVMAAMIGYSIYSYIKMRRLVTGAVIVRNNIYETDRIRSPFILGFWEPRIYIPVGLRGERLDYVLAHEGYHLRRRDHIVKTLAYLLLTIHWFNPLVWLAFHLMGKDMEMSCDEKVLGLREGANKAYSSTLLSFAAPHHFPAASPLCFGESSVKSRIRNALSWRKPKVWVTLVAAVLCVVALVACATNPSAPKTDPEPVDEQTEPTKPTGEFAVKITDLGKDTFRVEDAGFTPGLDVTVKLPESWVGRYTHQIGSNDINFYCKDTYDQFYDEGYPGRLCGIQVRNEVLSLDAPMPDSGRVLAVADSYSVVLDYPSDVQYTEETEREYRDMAADRDKVKITLSDWMLANTWNAANRDTASYVDFAVKIAYLGKDTFRVEDAGFTPGLDVTVKLPESWAGRYSHEAGLDYINFYCQDTCEQTPDMGKLFGIIVEKGMIPLNGLMAGNDRVLAAADSYSVVLHLPSDVQWTSETQEEYLDMNADKDKVEITLSDWMLANTWNETNWDTRNGENMMQAMDAAVKYFDSVTETGELYGEKMTFLKFIVSPEVWGTSHDRENGRIGDNDWAFYLTAIFVPEDPKAMDHLIAGNTHEYTGDDPEVPEGAWEATRVGYVTQEADGWRVEIVGTGW